MTPERELSDIISLIRNFHRGWIEYRRMARDIPHRAEQYLDFARDSRESAWWWTAQAHWLRDRIRRHAAQLEEAA